MGFTPAGVVAFVYCQEKLRPRRVVYRVRSLYHPAAGAIDENDTDSHRLLYSPSLLASRNLTACFKPCEARSLIVGYSLADSAPGNY